MEEVEDPHHEVGGEAAQSPALVRNIRKDPLIEIAQAFVVPDVRRGLQIHFALRESHQEGQLAEIVPRHVHVLTRPIHRHRLVAVEGSDGGRRRSTNAVEKRLRARFVGDAALRAPPRSTEETNTGSVRLRPGARLKN
jgi:hypothetical protein